jgi:hypothetical protein
MTNVHRNSIVLVPGALGGRWTPAVDARAARIIGGQLPNALCRIALSCAVGTGSRWASVRDPKARVSVRKQRSIDHPFHRSQWRNCERACVTRSARTVTVTGKVGIYLGDAEDAELRRWVSLLVRTVEHAGNSN